MSGGHALIAGWGVRLSAEAEACVGAWLERSWAAYVPLDWPAQTLAEVACIAPPQLSGDGTEREVDGRRLRIHSAGTGSWYMVDGAQGCSLTLATSGPAQLGIWGEAPQMALYLALTEAFRAAGWLSLHASAAVAPGDSGATVWLGRSGAGKSFRLLRALAEGAQPLAEDRAWLRASDLLLVARDDGVRLNDDAFAHFPALPRDLARRETDGKQRLTYADLRTAPHPPIHIQRLHLLLSDHGEAIHPPLEHKARALWEALGLPVTAAAQAITAEAVAAMLRLQ